VNAKDAGLLLLAYLCGSIPFGLLLTRWFKKTDVREAGSGNIGATNVARVAGKKLGLVVLLLDALKGVVPVLASRALSQEMHGLHAVVGLAAFLGHVFPLWLGFKGGKGVATALGVLAVLVPLGALVGFVVYACVFALLRVSSLGSLLGAVTAVTTAFVTSTPRPYAWLVSGLFVLLLFTHRANIQRLLSRSEKPI
jgi:acyl phosphate:glycerol-3-phosphate acyltransferase